MNPPVNFEGTIVFPAPEFVYTEIYMAPPLAPLDANTYAAGTVVSATSNPSGVLSGTHRFVVVASSLHFVVDATCYGSHLNSNKYTFF